MPRPRFSIRWLMLAVALAGMLCGAVVWLSPTRCIWARVTNDTEADLFDVRVTCAGFSRTMDKLPSRSTFSLGDYAEGRTAIIVSYRDVEGKQIRRTAVIGVDLTRPLWGHNDGMAEVKILPMGMTSERWYWDK